MIDSARIPRDKARLLLVALSQAGMIEPRRGPSGAPAGAHAHPGRWTSAPASAAGVARQRRRRCRATSWRLVAQTVRSQNHYWALGVEADDPTEAIDQAYEALARSFHPDRYRQRPRRIASWRRRSSIA